MVGRLQLPYTAPRGSLLLPPGCYIREPSSVGHLGLRYGVIVDSQDTVKAAHRGCAPTTAGLGPHYCIAVLTQARQSPNCLFLKNGFTILASLP